MKHDSTIDTWHARWISVLLTAVVAVVVFCGLSFVSRLIGGMAGDWLLTIAKMGVGAALYRAFLLSGLPDFGMKEKPSCTRDA